MPLLPVHGHVGLRERLAMAVRRHTLPASLLLVGPRGIGKQQLALWLARILVCDDPERAPCGACQSCRFAAAVTHPDVHWIFPRPRLKDSEAAPADVRQDYAEAIAERVEAHGLYVPSTGDEGIFVATVRAIVQSASMSPAMSRHKVFVIGDAERMVPQEGSDAAANAFLKLLEEPLDDTTLVLTSSEPGALLPTIRSRAVQVRVAPLSDAEVRVFLDDPTVRSHLEVGGERIDDLVRLAAGAPGRLMDQDQAREAAARARRLFEAAASPDRGPQLKVSLGQGAARARGRFTDTLDALTALLHERARSAASDGLNDQAVKAAQAVDLVEDAKTLAAGNVNPQLVSASLLRQLAPLLR